MWAEIPIFLVFAINFMRFSKRLSKLGTFL
jgi:hypothetical protein